MLITDLVNMSSCMFAEKEFFHGTIRTGIQIGLMMHSSQGAPESSILAHNMDGAPSGSGCDKAGTWLHLSRKTELDSCLSSQ